MMDSGRSDVPQASVSEAAAWLDEGKAVLVDVREPAEHAAVSIPGTIHIPMSAFDPDKLPDADDRVVVLFCAMGARSQAVAERLVELGFPHRFHNMAGGIQAWLQAGLPVER